MPNNAERQARLKQYIALRESGSIELTRQSIYDTYTITPVGAAIATGTWKFYKVPSGQAGKTDLDTNLDTAGQVPYYEILAVGLRSNLYTRGATPVTTGDFNQIYCHSIFELYKEDRLISREPLIKVPAGYGIAGAVTTAVGGLPLTIEAISNGTPLKSNFFDIYPELYFRSDRLQLDVRFLVAGAGVVALNLYLRMELEAEIKREYR